MSQNVAKIKGCKKLEAVGHFTVLRDIKGGFPGKTYVGANCVKLTGKAAFSAGYRFDATTVYFRDGVQLANLARKLMAAGDCIIVRGSVVGPTRGIRRLKSDQKNGDRATLANVPNGFLMADFDHVPNLFSIDPRTYGEAAFAYILSLLPKAMARSCIGYQWSSSTCVGSDDVPPDLGLHLFLALDEPLDEGQAKFFLKDLNDYVLSRLSERGHLRIAKYVDPKLSEAHQPHFLARPRFIDGACDPFPGLRAFGMHRGEYDTVDLNAVGSEIEGWRATRPSAVPSPGKPRDRVPTGNSSKMPPVGTARIYSLDALRAARDAVACREGDRIEGAVGRRGRAEAIFVSRAITGVYNLTYGRVASGEHDPRFSAWHAEGGFPEGQRDGLTNCVASLIVESLPLTMSRSEVAAYVHALLSPLVCSGWLASEWIGCAYERSVLDRYEQAKAGEKDTLGRDRRYHYRKVGVSAAFDPQTDEILTYGLNFGDRQTVRAAERHQAGMTPMEQFAETRRACECDCQLAHLIAQGKSGREAGRILGLPRGKLVRALAHPQMPALIAAAEAELAAAAETIVVALPGRQPEATPMPTSTPALTSAQPPATVVVLPIRPRKPVLTGANPIQRPSRIPLTG